MSTAKVFIEPNEDLVFACAKVYSAPAAKVIMVVPVGANITSSQVSLKLLSRMLQRTDKLVVLVTEEPFVTKYGEKANLVVADKISNVTAGVWEKANEIKQDHHRKREQKKIELIAKRTPEDYDFSENDLDGVNSLKPGESSSVIALGMPTGKEEKKLENDLEQSKLETNDKVEEEADLEEDVEKTPLIITNSEDDESSNLPDISKPVEPTGIIDKTPSRSELKIVDSPVAATDSASMFTKLEPKLVDLDGYAIISGGDLAKKDMAGVLKGKLMAIEKFYEPASKNKVTQLHDETKPNNGGMNSAKDTQMVSDNIKDPKGVEYDSGDQVDEELEQASIRVVPEVSSLKKTQTMLVNRFKEGLDQVKSKIAAVQSNRKTPSTSIEGDSITTTQAKSSALPAGIKGKSTYSNQANLVNLNFAGSKAGNILKRGSNNSAQNFRNRSNKSFDVGKNFAAPAGKYWEQFRNISGDYWQKFSQSKAKPLILLPIALLVVVMFGGILSPSAEISVVAQQQQLSVLEQIKASESLQEADLTEKTVPLKRLSKVDSRSETIRSTGTSFKGEKATTGVNVLSISANPVKLPAGSILLHTGKNGLQYVLLNEVNLSPSSPSVTNVKVEAANFGEEYNQQGSSKKDFVLKDQKVDGISIFTTSEIQGGTKTEIKVVAQSDIDNAVADLTTSLQQSLSSELLSSVSQTEYKLSETVIYGQPRTSSTKKAGEEAETFDVTVELEANIPVVIHDDLVKILKQSATENSTVNLDVEDSDFAGLQISGIQANGNTMDFSVSKSVNVSAKITPEDVKSKVLGLNVDSAQEQLENTPEIESVELKYSPSFVPAFMKNMPKDQTKIAVRLN